MTPVIPPGSRSLSTAALCWRIRSLTPAAINYSDGGLRRFFCRCRSHQRTEKTTTTASTSQISFLRWWSN
jgi:hypothetical protein